MYFTNTSGKNIVDAIGTPPSDSSEVSSNQSLFKKGKQSSFYLLFKKIVQVEVKYTAKKHHSKIE